MYQHGNYIYLGYGGYGHTAENSDVGAGGIAKYDIDSNHIIWSRVVTGTNSIFSLIVDDEKIFFSANGSKYYTLDPDNQTLKLLANLPNNGDVTPSRDYSVWYQTVKLSEAELESFSINQDQLDASSKHMANIYYPPRLVGNLLITLSDNEGSEQDIIRATNIQTSEVVWEIKEHIKSNIATNEQNLFFLTVGLQLLAADITTGKIVGNVKFSPLLVENENLTTFYVTANDNNQAFVYLGDSTQLFAFDLVAEKQ